MIKKFKKWYFRYGVLACANDIEAACARAAVKKYGGKILDNNTRRAKILIKSMIPALYRSIAKEIYVVNGGSFDNTMNIIRKFQQDTCGFEISSNPAIEDLR